MLHAIPPYTREFALVLDFKNRFPPGGTVYSGRLLIQYYQGNRLVQSKTYSKLDSHVSSPGSEQTSIVLDTQVLPLHGGTTAHSVVVGVLEADPRFSQYQDAMKAQVRGTFSWYLNTTRCALRVNAADPHQAVPPSRALPFHSGRQFCWLSRRRHS